MYRDVKHIFKGINFCFFWKTQIIVPLKISFVFKINNSYVNYQLLLFAIINPLMPIDACVKKRYLDFKAFLDILEH